MKPAEEIVRECVLCYDDPCPSPQCNDKRERIAQAITAARRDGAEAMRERAMRHAGSYHETRHGECWCPLEE